MEKLDYKLCYMECADEYSNVYKMYFTDNLDEQWGDDWNDRPASCNAERPYDDKTHLVSIYVEFSDYAKTIFGANTYSVQDLNLDLAPWLIIGDCFFHGGSTLREVLALINTLKTSDPSKCNAKVYMEMDGDDK